MFDPVNGRKLFNCCAILIPSIGSHISVGCTSLVSRFSVGIEFLSSSGTLKVDRASSARGPLDSTDTLAGDRSVTDCRHRSYPFAPVFGHIDPSTLPGGV